MACNLLFMVVGQHDSPLYVFDHCSASARSHYGQFILHAALDVADEAAWHSSGMYLKVVDRHCDQNISAFLTAGNVRLMMLHDFRNDEGIKQFFQDVYELYVKVLLNPFCDPTEPITSPLFDIRVKALAKRHLKL